MYKSIHFYIFSLQFVFEHHTSAHRTYVQFRTLQWIRQDAPIIIHVKLDCVLQFLLEDTHYRNLFEVGTGRGSTDFSARKSWEVSC